MDAAPAPMPLRARTGDIAFRVLLPLLVAFAMLGHTLAAPLSLIDDGLFCERALKMIAAIKSADFAALAGLAWTPEDNRFGPGLFVQILGLHAVCGANPMLLHLAKTLNFAVVLAGIAELARLSGRGRTAAAWSVLLFALFARPTIFPDFQTHLANWQRLHTTDSYFVWFSVWMAVALLHALRSAGRRRLAWSAFAACCMALAALTKISAVAHVGGAVAALLFVAWHRRAAGEWKFPCVLAGCMLAVSLPGLFYFRPWQTRDIALYSGALSFDPLAIRRSVGFSVASLLEGWGPLPFAAAAAAAWRFVAGLAGRRPANEFAPLAIVLGIGSAAWCLQMLWSITLPRYMVTYTPFAAVLCGIAMESAWIAARSAVAPAFARPAQAVAAMSAAVSAAVLIAAIPILAWQRPTPLRWLPLAAIFAAGLAGLVLHVALRRGARFASWTALAASGVFFGTMAAQMAGLALYAHQAAVHYLCAENARLPFLETALAMADETGPAPPRVPVLYHNAEGEPRVQTEAFLRAFGVSDRVRLASLAPDTVLREGDRLMIESHENHWDSRVVPPVVAGWNSQRLAPTETMDGIVVLRDGQRLARTISVQPGTTITGLEFRANVASWPARSTVRIELSDASGVRATILRDGRLLPRMNTDTTFLPVDEPFVLAGNELRIEAAFAPSPPSALARHLQARAGVAFPAVRTPGGELAMMAAAFGTADPAPRFAPGSDDTFEASSYVVVPPFSLVEELLFRRLGPGSPMNLGFRPVRFRYRIEVYR